MQLADRDLNAFMTLAKRNKILKEVNKALDTVKRIDNQIKIWDLKPKSVMTTIMQDELKYLKEGRI